ncbi:hypothetical protein CRUP_005640 [Coryphaenoides rupestris]|nr:hypothetical protein CRUP_005640 [Coryphaenoides rupestris]
MLDIALREKEAEVESLSKQLCTLKELYGRLEQENKSLLRKTRVRGVTADQVVGARRAEAEEELEGLRRRNAELEVQIVTIRELEVQREEVGHLKGVVERQERSLCALEEELVTERTAQQNVLSRDRVINELRLRLPATAGRERLLADLAHLARPPGGGERGEEGPAAAAQSQPALQVAHHTIGSLQGRLEQKEEVVKKYQELYVTASKVIILSKGLQRITANLPRGGYCEQVEELRLWTQGSKNRPLVTPELLSRLCKELQELQGESPCRLRQQSSRKQEQQLGILHKKALPFGASLRKEYLEA